MNAITLWSDTDALDKVREMYAPKLSDEEFKIFATMGRATGLNPALREIWAVKFGNNPASIFVGRDGYRRSAQAHKDYEYHMADAVYTNDVFEIKDGKVNHKFDLKNRGEIAGAYCLVKKKGSEVPAYNFVEFSEYNTGKAIWKDKPATMIKKVAEAQGLRGSFQELFAGTLDASEENTSIGRPQGVREDDPGLKERLIEKLRDSKDLKLLDAASKEVAKEMGRLTEKEIKEISDLGKEMREKFAPKVIEDSDTAIGDPDIIDEPGEPLGKPKQTSIPEYDESEIVHKIKSFRKLEKLEAYWNEVKAWPLNTTQKKEALAAYSVAYDKLTPTA